MKRYLCIHGHFYQPPRENPWLERVEVDDSAAPYHDWNQRITDECYAPNTRARILDRDGCIERIVNNFEKISFNIGPTLMNWLADNRPEVYEAIRLADKKSISESGHGNAMAQVYNHIIMPLARRRDKLTQIKWGAADFKAHYGRLPQGMWLAETAVDIETLECLATEGIAFTILAPSQAEMIRKGPDRAWQKVGPEGPDTGRAYRVNLPGGRNISVLFYDAALSRGVAFEGELRDGAGFARRLAAGAGAEGGLTLLATDGESYGHHHHFGEMALAFALEHAVSDYGMEIISPTAFLAEHPPLWEARIRENSSWSCVHGVERWRKDCGCALDPDSGWSQAWREPLRQGLDRLKEELDDLFEKKGAGVFKNPWAARDAYHPLIKDPEPALWRAFEKSHALAGWDKQKRAQAVRLLESQRFGLLMFTSCGWFFDDISGVEPVQNLRFAARAIELASDLGVAGLEEKLLNTLKDAKSNLPQKGDGARIWKRRVASFKVGPFRAAAHAAIGGLPGPEPLPRELYCWRFEYHERHHHEFLGFAAVWGRVGVEHRRYDDLAELDYAAFHFGGQSFSAFIRSARAGWDAAAFKAEIAPLMEKLDRKACLDLLRNRFRGEEFGLGDMFLEGRRDLAMKMLSRNIRQDKATARAVFENSRETMLLLKQIRVPLPGIYQALAETVISGELIEKLAELESGVGGAGLKETALLASRLGLNLNSARLRKTMQETTARILSTKEHDWELMAQKALLMLDLATGLSLDLDLWQAQNAYHILTEAHPQAAQNKAVKKLAARLGFRPCTP